MRLRFDLGRRQPHDAGAGVQETPTRLGHRARDLGHRALTERVRVCALQKLLAGERFVKEVGEYEILVLHAAGEHFAISNICSHEEVWLDDGILHEASCELECPMHEGRFDLRTGEATHEPAEEAIPTFQVVVEGDDVYVEVPD